MNRKIGVKRVFFHCQTQSFLSEVIFAIARSEEAVQAY